MAKSFRHRPPPPARSGCGRLRWSGHGETCGTKATACNVNSSADGDGCNSKDVALLMVEHEEEEGEQEVVTMCSAWSGLAWRRSLRFVSVLDSFTCYTLMRSYMLVYGIGCGPLVGGEQIFLEALDGFNYVDQVALSILSLVALRLPSQYFRWLLLGEAFKSQVCLFVCFPELGAGQMKEKHPMKHKVGHFGSQGVPLKRKLKEFPIIEDALLHVGTTISVRHFVPGQFVDVIEITHGKGFAGSMKRHSFSGMPASHGASLSHRSIGRHPEFQI